MAAVDDTRAASYRRMVDEIAAAHGRANTAHEQRCNRIDADRKTSPEQKAALRIASNRQRSADRTIAQRKAEEGHLTRLIP